MTAEERAWYINRHNEEIQKRNEQERKSQSGSSRPNVRR